MNMEVTLRKTSSSSANEVYRQRKNLQRQKKRKRNASDLNCSLLHELKNVPDCIHCGARRFEYEPPTFCCDNGKVKLAFSEVPPELDELFTAQSEEAINFRRNIRAYNSIFSFTSFGVKLDKELASARRGVYSFQAQGMVYHDLPGLIPQYTSPTFFQLYFYDTQSEFENRINIMQNQVLSEAVVQMLMKILEINPYAKFFRRLKDYPSMDNVQLHISKDVNLDQRVYNSPHADQVAAIWVEGNNENIPLERDIVVHAHSGDRHRIKHYYGCYDPLQYPLLFPMGETGWHQNIRKIDPASLVRNTNSVSTSTSLARTITACDIISNEEQGVRRENVNNVSCREYICYKIQIRNPRQSILLLAGRLLQQYIVDMYIKLETTRLDYYRQNQSTMRAELYQGIVDSVFNGELRGNEVGKRIVLPATFIGGP
ncbi:uncharacterized protein LOC131016887 [Salvia miltiorrhiza]|uniref:uncharacterized protein LOC131016887 n=1 Tax=Salvia miltiorrhiza TaxID=226208 RepID=UPI0025AD0BA3|nr:uncharacterized protein LOC131016887 [Salvia miltiorrhiza]